MATESVQDTLARNIGRKAPRLSAAAPWCLVVVLLISNAATVLSEQFHANAYDVVTAIASIAGRGVVQTLAASSPSQAKARAVELQTRRLRAESAELSSRSRNLERELNGLRTSHSALLKEHETVKTSRAALMKQHEALRAVSAKRASAVRAISKRTTAVLAARASEAVSSLPVRAAPYVGIAALLGFTTWEIKTDCDIAKAIAELNSEYGNEPVDTGKVCGAIDSVPSPQQAWNGVKSNSSAALKTSFEALESAATRLGLSLHTQQLK